MKTHTCTTEDDFWRARNFLREVFLLNDRLEHSWNVARLDYWRWHYIKTCNVFDSVEKGLVLWENADGKIIAALNHLGDSELRLHTIKIKNEVIGLMIVVRKNDIEFSRDAQTMLEAMADYASISLVNARLFRAIEQTAENARVGEKNRYASLGALRKTIRDEVDAAVYPLNLVLTEMPGTLTPDQKKALETVRAALQRLAHSSENTITTLK
ncbi:MAG: hypothetical protein KDD72_04300 [Anaerolineales bacterium]|nr:hypothetical protein [Anaerolineales bacterium]